MTTVIHQCVFFVVYRHLSSMEGRVAGELSGCRSRGMELGVICPKWKPGGFNLSRFRCSWYAKAAPLTPNR